MTHSRHQEADAIAPKRPRGRRRPLFASTATAAVASALSCASARAQPPAPPPQSSEVVVTGSAYASVKTIEAKRELNVVSDGVSANQIGELPEFGLGDALAAVPGVSFVINNGRGEDQFMTIRGLNPDYDSVTLDGVVLPSTEETVRSFSFDVVPSVVVAQANVLKSWTADQPTDAVGGVTDLHTRSAFDHPGDFLTGHFDGAYWEDEQRVHPNVPSFQGDIVASKTFGPGNEFGALGLVSYYQRSSSTLNTYTLPYSYYPSSSIGNPVATPVNYSGKTPIAAAPLTNDATTSQTLAPSQSVAGDIAVPDRHRWYSYDNVRSRPGLFTRLDFDDHRGWKAHLTGGVFVFKNDENRYSQYLNRVGPANIVSATTGSFYGGLAEADFDKYIQWRQLGYVDGGVSYDFTAKDHLSVTGDYGVGHYRQNTAEDQFTQPSSVANDQSLAFNYNLSTQTAPLFTPVSAANFSNPALYIQQYHLNAVDQSKTLLPQARIDFTHNFAPTDLGFGFALGGQVRDLTQSYSYYQYRLNPISQATAPTLAQIGVAPGAAPLYDGYGQNLLLVSDPNVVTYLNNNASAYVRNASDTLSNTVNNYTLNETITAGYAQADYRLKNFYALFGLRFETTSEKINNYLPSPFSSQTNFVNTATTQYYSKLLPSLNLAYSPLERVTLRGAASQTLARPEYAQLGENSSASVSGATASETISNPNLKPRESTNYDLSAEYYFAPGALASIALFEKDIKNEIITLTTTTTNVLVPGYATPVTLTTTEPENANKARVRGVELNLVDSSFSFLPGPWLKGFGGRMNIAFIDMNAPYIRMSDGSFRHLPQLTASSHEVANAALFYTYHQFSVEVAYNHTGKQPISFDTNNQANDQWWAAIDNIDAQFRYAIARNIDFRVQVKNLQDSRPQKVVGPTQNLNYSALENGRAYFAGVAVHF